MVLNAFYKSASIKIKVKVMYIAYREGLL